MVTTVVWIDLWKQLSVKKVNSVLMQSFKGYGHKFEYKFFGHSGDGPAIDLIGDKAAPKNEKEMFDILAKMQAHASYCISGG
jgi:hypothetical protein